MKSLKITLACNGGVSTKMLCTKIIAAAKKKGYEIDCDAYSVGMLDSEAPGSDVLLLGPQIKFMKAKIKSQFPNIPVEIIDMQDYGTMNGDAVFDKLAVKFGW